MAIRSVYELYKPRLRWNPGKCVLLLPVGLAGVVWVGWRIGILLSGGN
jgi:hypothetical protein